MDREAATKPMEVDRWNDQLAVPLSEGQVLLVQLQMAWRRTKSHSRELPGVRTASAVMNLLKLCELPRLGQEILHRRIWQEQSTQMRMRNDRMDFTPYLNVPF